MNRPSVPLYRRESTFTMIETSLRCHTMVCRPPKREEFNLLIEKFTNSMARYTGPTTKNQGHSGEPIFRYDKSFEKRKYAPGQHGLSRKSASEYGVQLKRKTKGKIYLWCFERQFRKTFESHPSSRCNRWKHCCSYWKPVWTIPFSDLVFLPPVAVPAS